MSVFVMNNWILMPNIFNIRIRLEFENDYIQYLYLVRIWKRIYSVFGQNLNNGYIRSYFQSIFKERIYSYKYLVQIKILNLIFVPSSWIIIRFLGEKSMCQQWPAALANTILSKDMHDQWSLQNMALFYNN